MKNSRKFQVHMNNEASQIVNRYVRGEETSFTIIAYPVPSIGDNFQEIFRETVKINTLDYNLYQKIQQKLIDALDQGTRVHVTEKMEIRRISGFTCIRWQTRTKKRTLKIVWQM